MPPIEIGRWTDVRGLVERGVDRPAAQQDGDDDRGREHRSQHEGVPPRADVGSYINSVNVVPNGLHHTIRQQGGAILEEGLHEPIEVARSGHAGRSFEFAGPRASASRAARRAPEAYRSRDLTVPSGRSRWSATSTCVNPR